MRRAVIAVIVLLAAGAAAAWWWLQPDPPANVVTLYGTVDLRTVHVAFKDAGQLASMAYEEGDRVEAGARLAELETSRLESRLAAAEAKLRAQEQLVAKLEAGTRQQEVDQARAQVEAGEAELRFARRELARVAALFEGGATTREKVDDVRTQVDVAESRLRVARETLNLALAGPRDEDVARARAERDAAQAQVDLLQERLADSVLVSPRDGIIENRLVEPGEMVSPERPVYTIAALDPKWVRAYLEETDLGRVKPGMAAAVTTDSYPEKSYEAWVGHIAPDAEFTPKWVHTPELRTALVYLVRIYVRDPDDELRLGMPATVTIDLQAAAGDGEPAADGE